MLTPDQLAAIKARSLTISTKSLQYSREREDIFTLVNELERLTRHNQRMSAALAQLSDKENWLMTSLIFIQTLGKPEVKYTWIQNNNPIELAERALVEDE